MKTLRAIGKVWLLSLLICALAVAVAFFDFDTAITRRVYGIFGQTRDLAIGLRSAVLLTLEAIMALVLVLIRIMRGRLSPLGEAVGLACVASLCAYTIDTSILKVFLGVPNPTDVLQGTPHRFNFLHGFPGSSFPSGHMALAGAFAGVFMRLYRTSVSPLFAFLALGAALLIMGDWHFVSDVIAGTFIGVSAGLLAGEVWLVHSN